MISDDRTMSCHHSIIRAAHHHHHHLLNDLVLCEAKPRRRIIRLTFRPRQSLQEAKNEPSHSKHNFRRRSQFQKVESHHELPLNTSCCSSASGEGCKNGSAIRDVLLRTQFRSYFPPLHIRHFRVRSEVSFVEHALHLPALNQVVVAKLRAGESCRVSQNARSAFAVEEFHK